MNVIDIKGAAFGKRDVTAAGNLGEAGETRFDRKKQGAVAIVTQFTGHKGAGTDEGDIATQDIDPP